MEAKILIITDLGEAESESIPLKIRYDQIFFMIPHRGTEITEKNRASVFSAALCEIFFYNPTQRHRALVQFNGILRKSAYIQFENRQLSVFLHILTTT